jgi:hypothetical protein
MVEDSDVQESESFGQKGLGPLDFYRPTIIMEE